MKPNQFLKNFVGKRIVLERQNGEYTKTESGVLLGFDRYGILLDEKDGGIVLYPFGLVKFIQEEGGE